MSDLANDDGLAANGRVEGAAGDFPDRPDPQADGPANRVEGLAQDAAAKLKDKAADLGETVSTAAATAADQAKDLYAQATHQYEIAAERIDPFVRERPYTAIGIAAVAGLLAGLLCAGRGSKVVYLKTPRA